MSVQKGTEGAGIQDHGTAGTRVGLWYATGPEDRSFVTGDPAFAIFRVVSDDADVPDCVTVENNEGRCFPVPIPLVDAIAAPTRLQAGGPLDQSIGQGEQGA